MRSKSSIAIITVVAALNLFVWAFFNRPQPAMPWAGTIRGVSFSPYHEGQSPFANRFPSAEEIDQDLAFLADKVASVRTYTSTDGFDQVPALAARHGLRVTAGAWLDRRKDRNDKEVENLIASTRGTSNIDRLMVGNEVMLRADMPVRELIGHIRKVRKATRLDVSTAEPWHVWLKYPELAREVDFITIHLLPYWESIPAPQALEWVIAQYDRVKEAFPGKHVVIGEVGWPSEGERFGKARASLVSEAKFLRAFFNLAQERGYDYFIMEAFDQPWKRTLEGVVGCHWGIFDVNRQAKFPMVGEVVEVALWPWQAGAAGLLAVVPMVLFLIHFQNLRQQGRLFMAFLIQATASLVVWSAFVPFTYDLTTVGKVVWAFLLPAQLLLLAVVLINGLELAEMLWTRTWRRFFPARTDELSAAPMVSLHLAICNEPPEMVKETLSALARLDYPNFEVLVIDNNTRDDALWQPVAEHCAALGPRFRFFHLPKWPGYKAGALNFALKETSPEAEIFGVVDSDYVVEPNWLRAVVPYFEKASVGFVQAPQDNRAWEGNTFKEMINWEYNGFFQIGMVQRNERNAIIQHGTMTLIRKAAMDRLGGWSEWCICEDAELGLRLMAEHYEAVYVNHEFGRGLTPETFAGYKTQRFRWVYGAVQIVKRHWRSLLSGRDGRLTAGQRFHFLAGWLPWFADAVHLIFAMGGVFWTVGILLWPKHFEFPLTVFTVPLFAVFVGKMLHALVLYRARVRCTVKQRLGAAVAGMGLTHIIARAVLTGLTTNGRPFLRTPKAEDKPALVKGFLMAWEELELFGILWLSALCILFRYGLDFPEAVLWSAVLIVQSAPYGSALATSLANAMPQLSWRRLLAVDWRRRVVPAAAKLATQTVNVPANKP
ncbi:MAG: glycosyltransferase [Thermodesulfobacteriota bacterium]